MGNTCTPPKKVPVPEDVLGQGCVLGRCRSSRAGQEAPGQRRTLWVKKNQTPTFKTLKMGFCSQSRGCTTRTSPIPVSAQALGETTTPWPPCSQWESQAIQAAPSMAAVPELLTAGRYRQETSPRQANLPSERSPWPFLRSSPAERAKQNPAGKSLPTGSSSLPAQAEAWLCPPQQGMNLHSPQRGAMQWAGQSRSACRDVPGYWPVSIWEEVSGSPETVSSPRTLQYSNAPAGEEAP